MCIKLFPTPIGTIYLYLSAILTCWYCFLLATLQCVGRVLGKCKKLLAQTKSIPLYDLYIRNNCMTKNAYQSVN